MQSKSLFVSALALAAAGSMAQAQEITMWTITNSADAANAAYQDIISGFAEANPGMSVKIEQRGVDEHKAALRVASASTDAPDIFFMWAGLGLGGEFVNAGLSLPLDDYYAQYGWDDRFTGASAGFSRQYEGGRHGVPFKFHGEALYYNKAMFDAAGITELPTTYEELKAAAQALKDSGVAPITFGGTVNWHVMRLMDMLLEASCGAETHDALKAMSVSWTETQCATDAFAELKDWSENYILSPFMGIDQSQSYNLFIADRAAMMLEGDWLVGQLREAGRLDDMGVFPFPTGADRLYGFAEYYYVSTTSEHPDVAAAFLDYISSDEVQQKHYSAFGSTSVNANVTYDDPSVLDEAWFDIFGSYSETFVNGDQAFPLDMTTEYFRIINEVASLNMEPADAASAMQSFIDNR